MPRYMLDADAVSYGIRGQGQVGARIFQYQPSELCISSITLAELRFGAEVKKSQKLQRSIRSFIKDVAVVPFDETSAEHFGIVAAALARRGVPIGTFDTLLAAHALSLGLTLVTINTKHFSRVPGLVIENWA